MFGSSKKQNTLVTHNGKFHADDIFACAILQLVLEKRGEDYTVIRTRDPKAILEGDFVFDVGGEYDPARNRFDHHQLGGAGKYDSDIPYAAVGLVWKHFGEELCGSERIAGIIEGRLIMPIDADDNGVALVEPKGDISPYRVQEALYAFRPTWKEGENFDERFLERVTFAKELLKREIIHATHAMEAEQFVREAYEDASDKRLVVLDEKYPYHEVLGQYKEPLYVVYPRKENDFWSVSTIPAKPFSFENRKDFPAAWAGLRDVDLQAVTGVEDAIFCHNGRFLAVAKSKEGALKLAKLALDSVG